MFASRPCPRRRATASSRTRSRRSAPTRKPRSRRRSSRRRPSSATRSESDAEEEGARGRLAEPGGRRAARDRRGRDRGHRLDVDGDPCVQAHRGRDDPARAHGGRAAQAGHRAAPGDRRRLQGHPARPRGDQGSEAPDRLVHLPRPVGRRKDRARAHSPSSCSGTRTR